MSTGPPLERLALGRLSEVADIRRASMTEMADAGERHGHIVLVSGGDDFLIASRTPGLYCSRRASLGGGYQTIGEWKESVAANNTAFERQTGFAGFPHGNTAGVNPAHLACPYAQRSIRCGVNNRIRLHMLHHAPAKQHRL